jgi:hypothetical protein
MLLALTPAALEKRAVITSDLHLHVIMSSCDALLLHLMEPIKELHKVTHCWFIRLTTQYTVYECMIEPTFC